MSKWLERTVIVVVLVFMALACLGMYVTWRDCNAVGGVTVKGLFGLECIRR